jgi:hypothetical protein
MIILVVNVGRVRIQTGAGIAYASNFHHCDFACLNCGNFERCCCESVCHTIFMQLAAIAKFIIRIDKPIIVAINISSGKLSILISFAAIPIFPIGFENVLTSTFSTKLIM